MALRDHPRLPEKTRERIKGLAAEMGYAPDPLLSALATYRTRSKSPRYQSTIAYLTDWTTEWGWKETTAHPAFYRGAEKTAHEFGFKLEHIWRRAPGLADDRLSKVLVARGINGLILASHGSEAGRAPRLDWSNFSCVKIAYFSHEPRMHKVGNYQIGIIRLAMRKVMEAGYRRIGFVMHRQWDHAVDHNWTAGYLSARQGIEEKDWIPAFYYPDSRPGGQSLDEEHATCPPAAKDFAKWLHLYKPEVILSNGAFVRPVLKELGVRIPQDIAFVDLFLSDLSGATAGVRQNHEAVGALALALVSAQMQHNKRGIPEYPTTTFVEGTWFDGASCPFRRRKG